MNHFSKNVQINNICVGVFLKIGSLFQLQSAKLKESKENQRENRWRSRYIRYGNEKEMEKATLLSKIWEGTTAIFPSSISLKILFPVKWGCKCRLVVKPTGFHCIPRSYSVIKSRENREYKIKKQFLCCKWDGLYEARIYRADLLE